MENITNFCKRYKIKYLPVKIEIDLTTTPPTKTYLDWTKHGDKSKWKDGRSNFKITDFEKYNVSVCEALYDEYKNETHYIGIDATDIQQLDIDDITGKYNGSELEKEFNNLPHYISLTKKQPHYFMKTKYRNKKLNENIKIKDKVYEPPKNKVGIELDDGFVCDHDVLYKGCWGWCRADTMVYNGNNNMEYNKWDNMTPPKSPIKEETKREKVIEKTKEIKVTQANIEMAELMNVDKYLTDYDAWSKSIWAMRNAGFTYEFCMKINQKSTKIDQIKDIWNSTTNKKEVSMGTIYYQAKQSNEKEYYNIKIRNLDNRIFESNEYNISEILLSVFGDNLVFYNGIMMVYTKDKWRPDAKLDLLRVMISQEGHKYYSKILSMLYKQRSFLDEDDPTYDILKKQINKINDISQLVLKTSWKNNITKEIQALVIGRHDEVDFNADGNVLAFKNIKYNFTTKKFEPILKEEYISFSTGYDWEQPTPEKVKKIDTFFSEIFPNKEIRKSYLSIMRTSLLGYTKKHFIVANGAGGNGKGLLNELLMYMLGDDYSYNGNLSVLVDKIKGGANPELANMHKKRLVLFKEPNQKDKIQLGNLKQLVDNESINARGLYQTNTITLLLATFILECNKKLNFSGEVDESEYRRILDVLFESTFTTDDELLNDKNLKNVYRADQDYKQVNFKKEYCCALFQYIIDKAEPDIYIPECVKERTKDYIDSNDSLLSWAKQHYIYDSEKKEGKPAHYIKVADMFIEFRGSDEYDLLHKTAKPTKAKFLKQVKENKSFRTSFYERKCVGSKEHRNILLGWRDLSNEEKKEMGIEEEENEVG